LLLDPADGLRAIADLHGLSQDGNHELRLDRRQQLDLTTRTLQDPIRMRCFCTRTTFTTTGMPSSSAE
jgi:hypothetical protein